MTTALQEAIDRLAEFNDDPQAGGITREVFTPTYARALDWVAERMRGAGLEPRTDAFGNLWGRWTGTEPDAPRVVTGSHVDTTLNAGKYDGVLGGPRGDRRGAGPARCRCVPAAQCRGDRLRRRGAALRHGLHRQPGAGGAALPRRSRPAARPPGRLARGRTARRRTGSGPHRRRRAGPGDRARVRGTAHRAGPRPRGGRRGHRRRDRDRGARRLPADRARRRDPLRRHSDGAAPRRPCRRLRADAGDRAARDRLRQRHDGRHRGRAARAAGRDQRRARRGRARRRRPRLGPRSPRGGGRGHPGRGARDRRPPCPHGRRRADRPRRARHLRPRGGGRRRGGLRRARADVPEHDQRRLPRRDADGRPRAGRHGVRPQPPAASATTRTSTPRRSSSRPACACWPGRSPGSRRSVSAVFQQPSSDGHHARPDRRRSVRRHDPGGRR